jgi:inner membrane protein
MYRKGHLGVSLLVFAPIGFWLVRAGHTELAFLTGGVMCWLAMLPDVDHRIPGIPHRGPTHSLLFAGLVGLVFGAVGTLVGSQVSLGYSFGLGTFGFLLGFVTVVAHLLGDTLTPAGVNYLWPLSSYEYTLSVTPADSTTANYALFGLGIFAVAAATVVAFRIPV